MKRVFYLFTILVISVSLVACGAKNPNPSNNTPTAYLPSYNGVQSTEYTPATTKEPLSKSKFTVKNTTDVKVYEDYIASFKKDGWTITQEQKVASFSAKKDAHIANILISTLTTNKDVLLTVQSK